jgi:2-oxoglutarate ferredoxin oxidoreductase subunit delta
MSAETGPQEAEQPLVLDVSLCKACGICIELCPTHVFDTAEMGEAVVARPEDCTLCLLCELHCPDFAIEVRRREKKETVADDDGVQHAGRVYAALSGKSKADDDNVTGDDERCAAHHEEN